MEPDTHIRPDTHREWNGVLLHGGAEKLQGLKQRLTTGSSTYVARCEAAFNSVKGRMVVWVSGISSACACQMWADSKGFPSGERLRSCAVFAPPDTSLQAYIMEMWPHFRLPSKIRLFKQLSNMTPSVWGDRWSGGGGVVAGASQDTFHKQIVVTPYVTHASFRPFINGGSTAHVTKRITWWRVHCTSAYSCSTFAFGACQPF